MTTRSPNSALATIPSTGPHPGLPPAPNTITLQGPRTDTAMARRRLLGKSRPGRRLGRKSIPATLRPRRTSTIRVDQQGPNRVLGYGPIPVGVSDPAPVLVSASTPAPVAAGVGPALAAAAAVVMFGPPS